MLPLPRETADVLPDGIEALTAALVAERQARQEAEALATGAEAMVAHLKLVIAKLRRERFGPSAEPAAASCSTSLSCSLRSWRRARQKTNSLPRPSPLRMGRSSPASPAENQCERPFPSICRASAWCSQRRRLARAAAASSPSLVRT